MNAKNKIIISMILSSLLLTGCGDGEKYDNTLRINGDYAESSSVALYEDAYESDEVQSDNSDNESAEKENNTSDDVIKKEMLVYTCNMTVDVLDFDTALNSFKNSLDTYGAFVGNENYSDGGSGGRWLNADVEKWKTYTATIRVPSADYNNFCDAAAQLGDLRSKNASVQNMSREYYDLSATLEIYEAKEERYKELLSTITDEKYAISVEEELTNIQIEISKLKTRMNDIQTDVAYSYVYITINEVKEYTLEPVKKDTFIQRLGNTVSGATSSFLTVMESILFIFIYLFPHIAVILLAVFIIIKIVKAVKKRKQAKYMRAYTGQTVPPVQSVSQPVNNPESETNPDDEQKEEQA